MSHDHACIEDRLAKLEEAVAELGKPKSRLVLKSECGKQTITLDAGNRIPGIWVEAHDVIACLYADKSQGPVVGVYGRPDKEGHRRGAMDAALSCDPVRGGQVFLVTADNEAHWVNAQDAGKGFQLKTHA